MARALAFVYAGLTIGNGGSADYHLTGKHSFVHDYGRAELSFEVVVQNATRATFLTSEATLLAAYRKPDQALSVTLSATTRHTFDPASNTGFNARASARLVPGQDTTANSARYACSVVVDLPANLAGRAGRRSSTVDVFTGPSGRRTLTVSGVYTALSNNAARAQFESDVDTYCNAILSGLTGTWQKVGTPTAAADDQNKTIAFSRSYEEIQHTPTITLVTANTSLINPRLTIRKTRAAIDSLSVAEPLGEVTAEFVASCNVANTDLRNLWENVVRPFMLAEVARVSVGAVAILRESPLLSVTENVVSASMTMLVSVGLVQARYSVSDHVDLGVILKPVWNGDPFARDGYQGPASHVKSVAQSVLSTSPPNISTPSYSGFKLVRTSGDARRWERGLPGAALTLYLVQVTHVFVRANMANGARGGGGTSERGGGSSSAAGGGAGAGGDGVGAGGASPLGIFDLNGGAFKVDFGSDFGIFDLNAGGFSLDFGP